MAYRTNRFARKARPYTNYGKAIGTALKYGAKAYKSYTKFSKKKTGAQNTVTAQYDTTLQYRKKRMPRYKKRGWINFSRKVNAVLTKAHGTKTVVMNQTCSQVIDQLGLNQITLGCHLYGKAGRWRSVGPNAEVGLNDLYQVVKDRPDDNRKYHFCSGVIDITARNISANSDLEVDLYVVTYGEDVQDMRNFQDLVIAAESETSTTQPQFSALTLSGRGVTLFDLPVLIKSCKMKILSKRKYFLPVGSTFTYQYRDAKNHVIPQSRIKEFEDNAAIESNEGQNSYIYPYLTKSVIMVAKKTIGSPTDAGELIVGCTRKYSYKDVASTLDEDGYQG